MSRRLFGVQLLAVALVGMAGLRSTHAAQILWLDASDNANIATSGSNVVSWTNKAPVGGLLTATAGTPTRIVGPNGTQVVHFDGTSALGQTNFGQTAPDLTFFVVTSVHTNDGSYNGFFSGAPNGGNDYDSGFNADLRNDPTSAFNVFNVEGKKHVVGGGTNYFSGSYGFDTYHIMQVTYGGGASGIKLYADGTLDGSTAGTTDSVVLDQIRVGARYYGGNQQGGTLFDGNIAEIQIYNTAMSQAEANAIGYALEVKYGLNTAYVPEPGSLVLLGIGLAVLGTTRLRRRCRLAA